MFNGIIQFFKTLWYRLFPSKVIATSRDFPLLERKSWSGKIGTYMEYQISFYQETTPVTPIVYPDHFLVYGLPDGLTYNQANGLIYGIPTIVGTYGVTIMAIGTNPNTNPTQKQSCGVVFTVRST